MRHSRALARDESRPRGENSCSSRTEGDAANKRLFLFHWRPLLDETGGGRAKRGAVVGYQMFLAMAGPRVEAGPEADGAGPSSAGSREPDIFVYVSVLLWVQ